jgi:hypothetical protein
MRVEVWPSLSTGVLIRPSAADAIFEVRGVANTAIQNSPIIYSYFNFSGETITLPNKGVYIVRITNKENSVQSSTVIFN